jgi:Na+/H+ antiporter NhaD/arsenite permease-like protein
MKDNNILNGTSASILGAEMLWLFWDLRWLIMLAIILVIVDFRFGIKAAKARGEKIRKSKAGRRTANKLIDYLCYLVFGGILGRAIGEPLGVSPVIVAAVCMGVACLFEVDSIIQNICESKGLKWHFSLWKMALALVKKKRQDLGDAIEQGMEQDNPK